MKPDEIELLKYKIDQEARLLEQLNQEEKKYAKTIVLLMGIIIGYLVGYAVGIYVGR